jgi:hypothetical protein
MESTAQAAWDSSARIVGDLIRCAEDPANSENNPALLTAHVSQRLPHPTIALSRALDRTRSNDTGRQRGRCGKSPLLLGYRIANPIIDVSALRRFIEPISAIRLQHAPRNISIFRHSNGTP